MNTIFHLKFQALWPDSSGKQLPGALKQYKQTSGGGGMNSNQIQIQTPENKCENNMRLNQWNTESPDCLLRFCFFFLNAVAVLFFTTVASLDATIKTPSN